MRRLLSDITAVLGFRYAVYLALLTASGLTEAVSLAAVVPLLAAVGVGSTSAAAGTIGTAMMSVIAAAGLAPCSASSW